jgi:hypothetical protein
MKTGFLIFPYYLLYEFAVPILEALGLLALLISIFFYDIDFNYLAIGSAFVYLFYISITLISVF